MSSVCRSVVSHLANTKIRSSLLFFNPVLQSGNAFDVSHSLWFFRTGLGSAGLSAGVRLHSAVLIMACDLQLLWGLIVCFSPPDFRFAVVSYTYNQIQGVEQENTQCRLIYDSHACVRFYTVSISVSLLWEVWLNSVIYSMTLQFWLGIKIKKSNKILSEIWQCLFYLIQRIK